MFYDKWLIDRAFLLVPAQAIVGEFLKNSLRRFPHQQKPASFSIDQALEKARKVKKVMAGNRSCRGGLGRQAVSGEHQIRTVEGSRLQRHS